jgi:hypothetical protein
MARDVNEDPSNGQITRRYTDHFDWPRDRRDGDPRAWGREYEAQLALGEKLDASLGLRHEVRAEFVDPDAPIAPPPVNFTSRQSRRR